MARNMMPTRMTGMLKMGSLRNSVAEEENLLRVRTFQRMRRICLSEEIAISAESRSRQILKAQMSSLKVVYMNNHQTSPQRSHWDRYSLS